MHSAPTMSDKLHFRGGAHILPHKYERVCLQTRFNHRTLTRL